MYNKKKQKKISDVKKDFSTLDVVVWDENRISKDKPLGKVSFTREMLSSMKSSIEKWYPLASADTEGTVSGEVLLNMKHREPTSSVPFHFFDINVVSAQNLISKDVNGL